jgi:hypothetical protein
VGLGGHYLSIKIAERTSYWLFYHCHPLLLQMSFFTIMVLSNNQGDENQ